MTNINQMELGLSNARQPADCRHPRPRRVSRTRWWFTQMRHAVDTALDWQPAPPARPEQTWFNDRRRLGHLGSPPAAQPQISG